MTSGTVWEVDVRDRRGIYHRETHFPPQDGQPAVVSLHCEESRAGTRMVPGLPDELEEWQLCERCFHRRDSDVPA